MLILKYCPVQVFGITDLMPTSQVFNENFFFINAKRKEGLSHLLCTYSMLGTSCHMVLSCLFFFFLHFLELHMEVPSLGELQVLAYTATATQDPSHICDLHHSSR